MIPLAVGCSSEPPTASATDGGSDCDDWEDYEPDIYNFWCYNLNNANYWYNLAGVKQDPDKINACAYVDPSDPGWEDEAKAICSERCEGLAASGDWSCVDEKWEVEPVSLGWCIAPQRCNDIGSDDGCGVIEDNLGATAAAEACDLACDLWDGCLDLLSIPARWGLSMERGSWTPATADVAMETTSTGSELSILGAGQSTPATVALTGHAAYTAITCTADACPFYLAQYELDAVSALNLTVEYDSTQISKTLSGLHIHLERPALGIWLPTSGHVIFPREALRMIASTTVSGTPELFDENGFHEDERVIGGYTFGTLDPLTGVLSFGATGSDLLGDFTIVGEFEEL